mgnify:CR=1 FL=1
MTLCKDDYKQVGLLHANNIGEGFLSSLGPQFLALLYRAIDECEKAVLFTHRVDGRIVGFVSGSEGMRPIYVQLLKHTPSLIGALLPVLFSFSKIRKVFELVFFKKEVKADGIQAIHAELLSIAVDPEYRGQGIAQKLYGRLRDYFSSKHMQGFLIVVGSQLDAAHRFYIGSGAKPIGTVQLHAGESSVLYLQSLSD